MLMGGCRAFAVLILLGFLSLNYGCGRGHHAERLPVRGTVTMASGERLNGSITFVPVRGRSGPSATTKLDAGKYEFDRTNGPTAGPHAVIIKRVVSRTDSMKTIAAGQRSQENIAEWTLSADIVDNGHYLQDLTIDH
ncbi:MAG: hypothetical protein JXB10_17140 [Pirellulales bacterium]|nr:hypothetical protein [Pirellulales bacterium]